MSDALPNYRLRDLNLLLSTIDRDHDNVRVRCLCHTGFAVFPNSKRPVTTEPQSENPDSLCRLDDVIEIPRLDRYTVHKNCHSSDIGMIGVCLVLSHSVVKSHCLLRARERNVFRRPELYRQMTHSVNSVQKKIFFLVFCLGFSFGVHRCTFVQKAAGPAYQQPPQHHQPNLGQKNLPVSTNNQQTSDQLPQHAHLPSTMRIF